MLVRQLLIGVMALTVAPVPHQDLQRVLPVVDAQGLLVVRALSDAISLLAVAERWDATGVPEGMSVSLHGAPAGSSAQRTSPLSAMDLQAWLLRGVTALSQTQKTHVKGKGVVFVFAPVPAKDLAAVVVRVYGTLYVREIKASS